MKAAAARRMWLQLFENLVCVCVAGPSQSEIHQQQKKYKEGTILFCPFGDTIFFGGGVPCTQHVGSYGRP